VLYGTDTRAVYVRDRGVTLEDLTIPSAGVHAGGLDPERGAMSQNGHGELCRVDRRIAHRYQLRRIAP